MPLVMSGQNNLTKAALYRLVDDQIKDLYVFQFNFPELSRNLTADYNMISPPGSMLPTAIFKSSSGQDFTISMMVDSSSFFTELGVIPDLSYFESLVTPDVDTYLESNSRWIAPPRLIFVVGTRTWDVLCLSVAIKETRYQRNLIPNRATVDLTFKAIYIDQPLMEASLGYMQSNYSSRLIKDKD
jgi:hypothetical protein